MFWKIAPSDRPAFLHADGSVVSYAVLADEVDRFMRRLDLGPGLIGIRCDGSYNQYVAYLGALNSGCPVLLLGPDQGADQTGLSLSYLYTPDTDELATLQGGATDWHPDLAVLLSTSGSTGEAKWVRLSFGNIAANARSIVDYLGLGPEDRAPMALPFQYSYGMSIVNSHLEAGAAIVMTEGSVVEPQFWKVFEDAKCTSLAGVPHSFELMEQANIHTAHLRNLRYMTQAGGRLGADRVRNWAGRGQAEGWDFFVMYGQTEAAPRISYLPPDLALESPSAIGVAIPGGEIWIADESGDPVPEGTQGELFYRGPNTMMGYATSDADLALPQGTDVLRTGDVARRLPNGAFEIVGRMKRFVKLFGLRISLDEVEKHLHEKGIEAVCASRNDHLYVFVIGNDGKVDRATVERHLVDWLGIPAGSFRVSTVETLPRQSSGKVDLRAVDALIEGMESQLEAEARVGQRRKGLLGRLLPQRPASVMEVFRTHFPNASISSEATFSSLGGDSLSYVAVSLELEAVLGQLPRDWSDMSVSELQSQVRGAQWFTHLDTPTLFRALAIMLIVAGHLDLYGYGGGGALTLFVVAGISLATFTFPQVLKSGSVAPVALLFIRLALLTFAYTLLNLLVTGYGEWPALLFIGNWISPDVEGSAWFVEVYLQLLLVLMLLLCSSKIRHLIDRAPFRAVAIAAASFVVVAAISDALVDTHHLYRRLPHLTAWFLLTGIAAGYAGSSGEKGIVSAILLAGYWQFSEYGPLALTFFPLASLALIWLPSVPFPRILTIGFRRVAGASLFIYLSHFQFATVADRLIGPSPLVEWIFAIVGGVLVWRLYEPLDAWLTSRISTLLSGRRAGLT